MRLEQSFEVPVPVAQAWGVLLDVEQIAPCMPGATLTGFDGTGFTGTVKVKLGPVSLSYKGTGRFTERDEPGRRVSIVASGQDSRGAGGASARVTAVLHAARGGEATQVKVVADLDIAGRAAQFGRGMIADVTGKLVKQFADCLAETIAAAPAPEAAAAPEVSAAPAFVAPAFAAPALTEPAAAAPESASAPAPEPAPAPAYAPLDAAAPPTPPPAAPVFIEPAAAEPAAAEPAAAEPAAAEPAAAEPAAAEPAEAAAQPGPVYTPPPATNTNPPEYHPLAMQEPPPGVPTELPAPSGTPAWAQTEPVSQPEAAYAYSPEPAPPAPAPAPTPAPTRPARAEAEPIDLLAISGAKGMLRRAAPVLIIVGLALIGLIVWLVVN